MAYQQPPYQQTVIQQPVVVQQVPVVVPLYSGPRFMTNVGPQYLRQGVQIGGQLIAGGCIMIMAFLGCGFTFMSLMTLAFTEWDMDFWEKFDMTLPPTVIPAIVFGIIGLTLLIISCTLMQKAKKNITPGLENTAGHVYSHQGQPGIGQPNTIANPGNTSGNVYSNQGQPAVGQSVPVVAAPMVMPGGPVYPQGSIVTYPNAAPVYQQPQPGYPNAPGGMPAFDPPPYSGPEVPNAPPEYQQQPAFAPKS